MKALRTLALKYPGCVEGVACQGTALESSAFKVRGKTFLFAGRGTLKLKLSDSLPEATQLAANEPTRYKVGAHGWVDITFSKDDEPPLELMTRWLDESYRLFAPRQKTARK